MSTEIKMDMSMIFLKINLTDRHNSTFSHSILKKENKIPKIDAKLQVIHIFFCNYAVKLVPPIQLTVITLKTL
jgi:hypothetical protein